MSIGTPTWTSVTLVGQPVYTSTVAKATGWTRIPTLTTFVGFGFGQGGFGQESFGGSGVQQSGVGTPVWTTYTND